MIEDEKISLDELQEEIQEFEDFVQSSDIVSTSHCVAHLLSLTLTTLTGGNAEIVDALFLLSVRRRTMARDVAVSCISERVHWLSLVEKMVDVARSPVLLAFGFMA